MKLRFNIENRHFYIDLVFYNYILKCFVLIDLKTEDLTHQDIGQMQMYINYYNRENNNPLEEFTHVLFHRFRTIC